MKKHRQWLLWLLILIALAVLGVAYYYGTKGQQEEKRASYSLVLYQNTDDEWATLAEGAAQAEEDLKVDVNYVYLSPEDSAREQAGAVKREIENGASGILLAAVDSEGVAAALKEVSSQVPVICVETGAGENFPVIRSDDYEMGKALGEKILKDMDRRGGDRTVTVLAEFMERDSVKLRYQGLRAALDAAKEKVTVNELTRDRREQALSAFLRSMLPDCGRYIAALDKYATEQAADAWVASRSEYEKHGSSFWIYGIGSTAATVNDLDNENIAALVYQNEFSMGYQGISALVEKRQKSWIDQNIDIRHHLVTKESLYEKEHERLLFSNT